MIYRFTIFEHYTGNIDIQADSQEAAIAWMDRNYGNDERTYCDVQQFDHGFGSPTCQCGFEVTEVLKDDDEDAKVKVHLDENGYEDGEY